MILAGVRNENLRFNQSTSSLIDVVFLLLIYFMVTASLIKREGDISFLIPIPDDVVLKEVPVEALIEVRSDGSVFLEGMQFSETDRKLKDLQIQIVGLRQIAQRQGSDFHVNLLPHREARHARIIDVMDACAEAGVEQLLFSKSIQ